MSSSQRISGPGAGGRRRRRSRSRGRRPPAPRRAPPRAAAPASRRRGLAVGEHEQPLPVALRLLDVVGGEDHRRAALGEGGDELPEARPLPRVEPDAGLVEQQRDRRASRPIAMLIRCWLPPESRATSSPRRSRSPVSSSISSTASRGSVVLLEPREQQQVLLHRQPPVERRLLRHPARRRRAAERTSPASASAIPARIDSRVVFPAPLGPITATSSPARAAKVDPSQSFALPIALDQPSCLDGGTPLSRSIAANATRRASGRELGVARETELAHPPSLPRIALRCPFQAPACAGCAAPRPCAAWSARPSCRLAT